MFNRFPYECSGYIEVFPTDYTVASVTGNHKNGLGSNDVTSISIFNSSLVMVMPKNFKLWFQNYVELSLVDLPNFPGFNAEDVNELTHLKSFIALKLPLITEIPIDAFRNMKNLEILGLNEMANLGNLDGDLLIHLKSLQILSIRGPNKINQISPGFFKNQGNTLRTVDFTNTKLLRVNYNVFDDLKVLTDAFFKNSGCLNANYMFNIFVKDALIADIRKKCQNISETEIEN